MKKLYTSLSTFNFQLSILMLLLTPLVTSASDGDTTLVQIHNKTFINWYGPFYKWGTFPSPGKKYHKVILHYTLQCPTGGCSDYDYTHKIYIKRKGSQNAIPVNFEIARLINAFGGAISQSWIRDYKYDVTDYAYLLNDSVEVGTNFEGYPQNNQGWLMTMTFEMIEGTPVREAYKVENVWNGFFPYGKRTGGIDTIENYLVPKKVAIDSSANKTILKIIPTGHGGGGTENCAEFCMKNYTLKVNNANVSTTKIWRDDCGLNPVYPGTGAQTQGTWVYDRANWCPGDVVKFYEHDLTSYATPGDSLTIDVNMQNGNAGDYTGYNFESQLISYKAPSFTTDVSMEEIISPNSSAEYARVNPICGRPEVVIRNTGTDTLKKCFIVYAVDGTPTVDYLWTGNLAFLDTAHVLLPAVDLAAGTGKNFSAEVTNPNDAMDQYFLNNKLTAGYKATPVYAENFVVNIRTNSAVENYCVITDLAGNVVYENLLDGANTIYMDTIHLPAGCYKFVLEDYGKDGLSWPFGSSGSGYARLKKLNENNKYWISFPGNFGTSITHYFTTSSTVGISKDEEYATVNVYPNPSQGHFMIEDLPYSIKDKQLKIYDVRGKLIKEESIDKNQSQYSIDLSLYPSGIFSLELNSDGKIFHQKLSLMPR